MTASISKTAQPAQPAQTGPRHSLAEDVLAIVSGSLLIAVGVSFFSAAGLLTGGTAGLAFLGHYASGWGFGALFFVLNLPFYWLAWRKLGTAFTVKTFCAVALLSVLTTLQPHWLHVDLLHPMYAAVAGGCITGTGFLILFRHRCSLGGVGILALWMQERGTLRAGQFQLIVDAVIVALAFAIVEPGRVLFSIVGAVVMNGVLAINHRPGRYQGH